MVIQSARLLSHLLPVDGPLQNVAVRLLNLVRKLILAELVLANGKVAMGMVH